MLTELTALPGGSYRMGSHDFYPEEAPVHEVTVAPFSIERHPVTIGQFAEFVAEQSRASKGFFQPVFCRLRQSAGVSVII